MGVRTVLGRLAAAAPPRVFVITGCGGRTAVEQLRADPRITFVDSPRSADVLLAAGGARSSLLRPALAVHDQMAHPRATVWWTLGASHRRLVSLFGELEMVGDDADPVAAVLRVHRDLQQGHRASEAAALPDLEPAPWRGVGPYGQGGQGMTGGVPYGRPMTGRAPDRDGLELDQLPVRLGPFFPPLPPGLIVDLSMQGDVIQEVEIGSNPYAAQTAVPSSRAVASPRGPFAAALEGPVSLAKLEMARARHHLRWLGSALHLHGLPAWSERARRLAGRAREGADAALVGEVDRFLGRLEGRWPPGPTLRWAMRGLGVVRPDRLGSRGLGPVSRAAGLDEDLRAESGVYRDLGFEVVRGSDGDAWSRLRQRIAETRQALGLAARAGGRTVGPVAAVESPRGRLSADAPPPSRVFLELLPDLLKGAEWGDAMTIICSLDLDMEEAARADGEAS